MSEEKEYEEYDVGDDLTTGGGFCRAPGVYHVVIEEFQRPVVKKDGSLVASADFRVGLQILSGTVGGQENKRFDETFYTPMPSHKDGGKSAKRRIDRFLLAIGAIKPEDRGKKVTIPWGDLAGRQFVCTCVLSEPNAEGKQYLGINFADIYHVDDPEVATVPKDAEALKLLPPSLRRIGSKPIPQPTAPVGNVDMGAI